jgi:hypothetical protein
MNKAVLCFFLLFTKGLVCSALEIKIPYPLVQKELERQMFSAGRSYLSGGPGSSCDYAYLENPRVFPEAGRLAIEATFKGSKAKEVMGRCAGVSKSFNIIISGVPAYRQGVVRFEDPKLQFKNRVADTVFGPLLNAFTKSLDEKLTVPVQADTQQLSQILNQAKLQYELKLEKFSVSKIEVLDPHILMKLDFTVALEQK